MQPQKNNSSLNGFVLGLIVGVLVTLLFTTKKGRQILRTLTEEGLHKFSEVEDIIQAMEDEAGYDDIGEVATEDINEETEVNPVQEVKRPTQTISKLANHGRKFFRKPTRKS